MRPPHTIGLLLAILACAQPSDTTVSTSADAEPLPQITGEWVKADDLLPPVSLLLEQRRTNVTARLRLSGVEATGSGVMTGSGISITFPDRTEPITGVFESGERLRIRLGSTPTSQLLLVRQPK